MVLAQCGLYQSKCQHKRQERLVNTWVRVHDAEPASAEQPAVPDSTFHAVLTEVVKSATDRKPQGCRQVGSGQISLNTIQFGLKLIHQVQLDIFQRCK